MTKGGVLARAGKQRGDVVPLPWPQLSYVEPRPGYLVIVLGAPGVGKSTLGLQWAYSLNEPVLVCSYDTSLDDQAVRVRAMLEGRHVSDVSRELKERPENWDRFFSQSLPLVRWTETPMVAEDLGELLEAEKEFLGGKVPALVIVDVVSNLAGEEDLQNYAETFKNLHRVARKQRTVVVALHHLKRGAAASGAVKFGLDEGLFSGERGAEIVLGIYHPGPNTIYVMVLKNRMGPADRNGDLAVAFPTDLAKVRIGELASMNPNFRRPR